MLRSLLVGVLALSTASACKGKTDAPAVQPGVAVGKVITISGTVTATRGTEQRTLAAGEDISGDDVIETAADASVKIQLAHNNATWELGPGRKQRVSESLAWKAPKENTPAAKVDETTLAAGRHAERETVTTTATAAPAAAVAPAPGSAPAPEPDMMAKGGEGGGGNAEPARKDSRRREVVEEKEKAAPPKTLKQEALRASDDPPAPPPPPPPPDDDVKADKEVLAPESVVKGRISAERQTLGACLESARLDVEVVVEKGVVHFVPQGAAGAQVRSCLDRAATKIKFAESYTLKVKTTIIK